MSNENMENTEPIKKRPNKDTQPSHVDKSRVIPVDPKAETMAVKKPARKAKTQSKPVPEAVETPEPSPIPEPENAVETASSESVPVPEETSEPAQPGSIPVMDQSTGNGEVPPKNKVKRGKWIWLGILGMLILILAGAGIGYASAMQARHIEEENQRLITATTQFELGLADQREGRLATAKQRFEYVLTIYPEFPGVADKLVEVGLAIAQNQGGTVVTTPVAETTPGTVITPVPTKDTRSVSALVNQANSQLTAQDWDGLYTTLSTIREIDPEYKAMQVDGMWYLALRNRGIRQIQAGHLEPGMYDFALAEQIAPIDADAESYRTWARLYLIAGANWQVNWYAAVEGFASLYSMVPQLRDASGITVTQRYGGALAGYGDYLGQNNDYCGAVASYTQASSIYSDTSLPAKLTQAQEYCDNPDLIPTPTVDPSAPTPTPTPEP